MDWTGPCPTRHPLPLARNVVACSRPPAAARVALGNRIEGLPYGHLDFGAAQIVLRVAGHYTAASDGRRDGQAVGF